MLRAMRYDTSREAMERDSQVEFYNSGGPGGQKKNKTDNAVRLRHEPSGAVVTASEERSRIRNLERAWERLAARLEQLNYVPKKRRPTRPTLGSQRRRIEGKVKRGSVKRMRGSVRDD
ncbi:peptide chain release factor-like protein [Vulgatibacter sp.]|uniref:peptide chain release factor-like protein n=1 Tax=Vulgatibacter sp. TaxID=1971226 RepID=UPI003562FD0F